MPHNPRGLELGPENIKKLKSIISREKEGWSVDVAQLDPDGIGCAFGEVEIMRSLGAEAEIYYGGEFDDPQNWHLRKLFDLDKKMKPMSLLPKSGPISLVDSCKLVDPRFGVSFDARRVKKITDHHLPDDRLVRPWRFVQICHAGAAATLIWRQGKALKVEFSKEACTLLALGIHNDTSKLRAPSTTSADRLAFAEAADGADEDLLAACHRYPLPPRYYDLAAKTYAGRRLAGPSVVSHPNRRMHTSESGFISRYADRLLQLDGRKVSIVWCLTEARVRASVRAAETEFDLNAMIDYVFGRGTGGSKHGSGGALVPLEKLPVSPNDFDAEMIAKLDLHFLSRVNRFFKKTPA